MIRQYELVDKVLAYNPKADVALLNRAYVFSMKAHGNQRRASGEPYLIHPLAVAEILADLQLDEASIAVGLLHDTLEDTLASYEEIAKLFGEDVAELTEGVTKLSRIIFDDKKAEQAENFRKFLLATSKDLRVLLVKLADRLHNMRTLHHKPKAESRRRVAQETLDIYIPLAERIGLYGVKTELEDLAFQHINPEEHEKITEYLAHLGESDDLVGRITKSLEEELVKVKIKAKVSGRAKSPYSIYRKMLKKNLNFDQLTDIVAYRIITKKKSECYEVLGLIHDRYKAVPGRFKDYISSPKPNGYQSIHTAVIGPFGNRMEVQIRTEEMHNIADNGVAAHWVYKEGSDEYEKTEGMQYRWVRELLENLQQTEDPEEFLENVKIELFNDNVFVFSPKGDLISLPRGATPLDFAFRVHSDVGHHCQTAKLNGRVVPLRTQLQNGDQIEIITNKNQHPNPAWREFVVTGRAKAAINRYLRSQAGEEQVKLGKELWDRAVEREGLKLAEKDIIRAAKEFKCDGRDGLFIAFAQGHILARQALEFLVPKEDREPLNDIDSLPTVSGKESVKKSPPIALEGLTSGLVVHMAKCCSPLPGEEIVGIITTGKGVSIHTKDCHNLHQFEDEPDRWINVSWGNLEQKATGQMFHGRLKVTLTHSPGVLASFSTAVFNAEGNITDLHIEDRSHDSYDLRCDVEVKDVEHLGKIVSVLRNLKCVIKVERIRG